MVRCLISLLVLAATSFPQAVRADFPTKPISLIVPYAGGSNDTLSRIIAEHMTAPLGQPVLVENVPGAAGTIATARVARATADGYTLIMGNMGTHGTAPTQYPDLKYDPVRDFTPIGIAAEVPAIIVTRSDFPAANLREFVAYVRANQDKLNEAHVGVGAPTQQVCFFRFVGRAPARSNPDLIAPLRRPMVLPGAPLLVIGLENGRASPEPPDQCRQAAKTMPPGRRER